MYAMIYTNITTLAIAKKSPSTLTYVRAGVKYTERLASNIGKSISWVWKNFWRLKTILYARTASGTNNDTTLRIIGMIGNVVLHVFLLIVRLFWSFLQSI